MYINHLRWSRYILPNGRKIFLTQRPDRLTYSMEAIEFIEREKVGIRFQYTDDWVDFPDIVPSKWFVWVPGKEPTIESVYSSIITLQKYNELLPIEQSFWMHCDSSSMRAPTYFGLFLHATYKEKVVEISDTINVFPEKDFEYASHSRPDLYAGYTLGRNKEISDLIKWFQKGEKYAYYYLMGYDMEYWGK